MNEFSSSDELLTKGSIFGKVGIIQHREKFSSK